MPRLCTDVWTVIAAFIYSWRDVVAIDNALADPRFHAFASDEVEARVAAFFGPGRPIDQLCVGRRARNPHPEQDTCCFHKSGVTACAPAFFVWPFAHLDVSYARAAGFVRCRVTGAIAFPSREKTEITEYAPIRQEFGRIVCRAVVRPGNPVPLRQAVVVRPRMRFGRIDETRVEVFGRILRAVRKRWTELRLGWGDRKVVAGEALRFHRELRAWLRDIRLDINQL